MENVDKIPEEVILFILKLYLLKISKNAYLQS